MLRELRLTDFCLFEAATLPLRKQGLVWICGDNRDTAAATSNGSGKTTLSKALTWCLYGESIDGEDGDEVIREGASRAVVELDLDGGWTIRRERAKGSPKLQLFKDGEPAKESKHDIQARIIELVGLDFAAFRNTALYGQNDIHRFADRRVSDKTRKEALQRLLRAEVLKVCSGIARGRAVERKRELAALEVEWDKLRSKLDDLDLDALKSKVEEWDAARDLKIEGLKQEAKQFKAKAQALLEGAAAASELDSRAEALKADLVKAEEAAALAESLEAKLAPYRKPCQDLSARRAALQADARNSKAQLKQMDGERCPVCDSKMDEGHAGEHRAALLEKQTALLKELAEVSEASDKAEQVLAELNRRIKAAKDEARRSASIRAELDELKEEQLELAAAHARAQENVERARDRLEQIKAARESVNPHVAYLEEARAKAVTLKAAIKEKRVAVVAKGEEAAIAEFWVRGFSGRGLPSFILDSVMPYITERANHYLDILADGDITIQFSTQRELKSAKGEYRDEIDIRWVIEDVADKAPSGGQQRKIEIATDLALMDLAETHEGARLSFFWADEVFDGLDSEGINRVLVLLHELRARKHTVFVVSHSNTMSEIFEKSITVVKKGGVSRLEVAA